LPSVINVSITSEDLAEVLRRSALKIVLGRGLDSAGIVTDSETVSEMATKFIHEPGIDIKSVLSEKYPMSQKDVLEQISDDFNGLSDEIRTWWGGAAQDHKHVDQEIAAELLNIGDRLKLDVSEVVNGFFKELIRFAIEKSIVPAFTIGSGATAVTVMPQGVTLTYDVKISPSFAALDVAGLAGILSGILSPEFSVEATYVVGQS